MMVTIAKLLSSECFLTSSVCLCSRTTLELYYTKIHTRMRNLHEAMCIEQRYLILARTFFRQSRHLFFCPHHQTALNDAHFWNARRSK